MTYTPGPWRFSKSELSSEWGLIVDSHENIIANVNTETGPDIPPLVSTKMPCKANGMLMAAAPDMLAALKRIRDYLYEREIFGYMRMEVEAAIAKAEGSSK
jgi:hypothetical protein